MQQPPDPRSPSPEPPDSSLAALDRWVASHPWHPRVLPFFVYIALLAVIGFAQDLDARLYVPLYAIQCSLVAWLLWRYRRLTPELTLRFHWLAVPVGVFVAVAWIALGWAMAGEFDVRWSALVRGEPVGMIDYPDDAVPRFATDATELRPFWHDAEMGPALGTAAFVLRLLGMSLIVPIFEELFIRSLMLRSLSDPRQTWIGLQQVFADIPGIGDWFMRTDAGARAIAHDPPFTRMFLATPLGKLTAFGVIASTFVFMLSHLMRDWPGIWVCGVAYCLLLAATANRGLGPVIWAHGLTNALLWAYTAWTGDWQFL